MTTQAEVDEIKAILTRGLENLAIQTGQKHLPLRKQTKKPMLNHDQISSASRFNTDARLPISGKYTRDTFKPARRPLPRPQVYYDASTSSSICIEPRAPPRVGHARPHSSRGPHYGHSSKFDTRAMRGRSLLEPPIKAAVKKNKDSAQYSVTLNGSKCKKPNNLKSTKSEAIVADAGEEGEEWSDIDEDDDFDPRESERTPGDGSSFDNYIEEEDVMDTLEDDDVAADDASDGYSIASVSSRTHSAKERESDDTVKEELAAIASRIDRASLGSRADTRVYKLLTTGSEEAQPGLTPSLFSNVPPTINFVTEDEKLTPLPWELRKLLKWRMSPITPQIVKGCIARSGFRATKKSNEWIGYWGKHMKASGFKGLRDYQKMNHIPGSFQIGRKDRLWRNLSRMQVHFGKKDFNFFPQTYVLPSDMKLLKRAWEDGGTKQKWIMKPPASARGIGIKVIHKWSQIPKRRPVIVQRYLAKPFLINGSKFDLRVYVYVTSFDPLRIYVFEDGLTRFATMKYSSSMKSLSNKFMHLTNYSINKNNSDFTPNEDHTACEGHKWTLKALWGYMKRMGIDTKAIWDNIKDLVVKTIISGESSITSMTKANVRHRYSVHELFGFDILLDENLKPWILEVNISPSLHSNSPLDISVKGSMIKDLLNLAGFQIPEKREVYPNLINNGNNSDQYKNVIMDKRCWNTHVEKHERAKHAFYTQKYIDDQCRASVVDLLTPDDLCILIETEDEFSRRGGFQRVFPSPVSSKFSRFFETPRYYNVLLEEWVNRYHRTPARGLALLEGYCGEKIHLRCNTDNAHIWTPISTVLVVKEQRTLSAPSKVLQSPTSNLKKSSSAHSLPKIKGKKGKHRVISSSSSSASLNSLTSRPPHPPFSYYTDNDSPS
ncbi:tubulin polyglutamylase TTLL4-like [Anneissia japonica]|uniref:tubulin polyglutamylase TTLL4-like n=1 Tax=Anneissia japonica TaxID=1529436 RepID=UPI0014259B83|nr:tubulin polyglutamylase TTLL4-like [Anneissia japonica]